MQTRRLAALGLCFFCLNCGSDTKKGGSSKTTPPDTSDSGNTSTDAGTGPLVIDGVKCGGALDDMLAPPYTLIMNRKVYIDYPCDLPKGTPVTFILNLHGTQDTESGKSYIRVYNRLGPNAQKYNFVVATPIAVTSQWGNGDNGQDAPYLAATVDWIYSSFSAFKIKQMWVTGHSWGAAYSLSYVCKPEYADRIRGLLFMSGGAGLPDCADRLSIIATVGETDIVPGQPDQSTIASGHGCAARSERKLGMDNVSEWASCSSGWVHQDWLMLGKGHGFVPTDWPDDDMVNSIAASIQATQPK